MSPDRAAISVLMATYAAENPLFLKQSLNSCLGQDLKPVQIVLVLDGPVGTAQEHVIQSFHRTAGHEQIDVCVVRLERNVGLGRALNAGLERCTQPYVARMDSDDISHPRRFAVQWRMLSEKPEIDLLACPQADFDTDPTNPYQIKRVPERHDEIVKVLKWRNVISHPSIVFKRALVAKLGGYRHLLYLEDYDLFMRMVRAGARLHAIQEPLILVRVNRSQHARRGGWHHLLRDIRFRWDLYRHGDISLPLCIGSSVLYGAFRLAPTNVKRMMYGRVRTALRQT